MVALRFATLWLALIAPAIVADVRADRVEMHAAADLELLVEPDESSYATGEVRRGTKVVVLGRQDGWATVEPPPETFLWVDAAALHEDPDGTCSVAARKAEVRYAAAGAKLPGPPCRTLARGTKVRLLDRADLVVGKGDNARTWRAIEPPGDQVRYVRLDAIEPADAPATAAQPPPSPRPERRASYEPEAPAADLPAEVDAELASIAATERAIRSRAIEAWDFDSILGRYESLLRRSAANDDVRSAIAPRLARARRDAEIGRKAREVDRLLRQGEDRDAQVARIEKSIEVARARTDRDFDAQGLLQPSSRRYQGQKVLALIGPEGRPVGYLKIPPGVAVNRFLAHKVGVRGIVHFDETLGARLISVRDIEMLDKFR